MAEAQPSLSFLFWGILVVSAARRERDHFSHTFARSNGIAQSGTVHFLAYQLDSL
jgi:hypothetical protein